MPNFFLDNAGLRSQFDRLDLREAVDVLEHGYAEAEAFADAPASYVEAVEYYRSALELFGRLAGERIAPRATAVDLEGTHLEQGKVRYAAGTVENIKELAAAGFMGVIVPRRYGGINFPATIYMMMIEMLSRADASLMTVFGYQDVGEAIAKHGTPEQGEEFLRRYTAGEAIGSMVMTEPGAGSDLQAIQLRAWQDAEGRWFLNGVKHFISNGNGEVLLVVARTDAGGMFGLSLFACHGGERVRIATVEKKMGLHGSPTCELHFDDAPAQLIGRRRHGFLYVLGILDHARFSVAAQALGIAEGAYREARAYARQRRQFGQLIEEMPPVANLLVEMRVSLDAMRAMLYAGAQWLDRRNTLQERIAGRRAQGLSVQADQEELDRASRLVSLLSPLTKYVVSEAAVRICYDAQQLHGGLGYMREMPVERMARDVRITTIYEGTSQVQVVGCTKGVLADALGDEMEAILARDHAPPLDAARRTLAALRADVRTLAAHLRDDPDVRTRGAAAKDVVDLYAGVWSCLLLLDQAGDDARAHAVVRRLVSELEARAAASRHRITARLFADLPDRDLICG
jgi:3-(methylthio)propanoyl-CoA dehydrogenase